MKVSYKGKTRRGYIKLEIQLGWYTWCDLVRYLYQTDAQFANVAGLQRPLADAIENAIKDHEPMN